MKNIIVTRIVLATVAVCLIIGIFVVQRQNKVVKVAAAEQLENADTVKKLEAFLVSQNERKTSEWTKLLMQVQQVDTESQNKKIGELLPAYKKLETNILNENIQAGEKILSLAKSQDERFLGYSCLVESYYQLAQNEFFDTCNKKADEAGIKNDDPEYKSKLIEIARKLLADEMVTESQQKLDVIIDQMEKEGKYEKIVRDYRGVQLSDKIRILTVKFSLDKFNKVKDEAKKWSKGYLDNTVSSIFQFLLEVASSEKAIAADNQIAAKTVKEITDYIGSDEFSTDVELRNQLLEYIKGLSARLSGVALNLYGRTINNEVFDWNSLRGKFVLVKFTASWCGPCKMEIPNMLKAYEKYHGKGLEIVSVYIFEKGTETQSVENVKKVVQDEKIPWIIISETLTQKAGNIGQSQKYSVESVPTMLLVDKDGKVIATEMYGDALDKKLAELFDKK
ncbi:MAG: TlpA family protein disulfide reductase [Planctomycetaceae bacterium]|jgi:thiol-disulfide isomerase/thioredoxin|nr:TlpA family protein disulfide reductase [Planctomycetaceae bacterium]